RCGSPPTGDRLLRGFGTTTNVEHERETEMKKAWLGVAFAIATTLLLGAQAHAATWIIESTVTQVNVKDDANNNAGSGDKILEITFANSGAFCGSTVTLVTIPATGHALWEEWIRVATSALLSGRTLRVGSSNATGVCKAFYLRLQN